MDQTKLSTAEKKKVGFVKPTITTKTVKPDAGKPNVSQLKSNSKILVIDDEDPIKK